MRRAQFRQHPFLARRDIADQKFRDLGDQRSPSQSKSRQPQPDRDESACIEHVLREDPVKVARTSPETLMGLAKLSQERDGVLRALIVGALPEGYSQGNIQSGR